MDVDRLGHRVVVEGPSGRKSRSFGELERVFNELRKSQPIHVDSVLGGSGSSRNQPETLFANLSSVEWLTIARKKHLILRPIPTHPSGSLHEVDGVDAAVLRVAMSMAPTQATLTIDLPVTDVGKATRVLDALLGEDAVADGQGIYVYRLGPVEVRVVRDVLVDASIRRGAIVRTHGIGRLSDAASTQMDGAGGRLIRLTDHLVIVDETQ